LGSDCKLALQQNSVDTESLSELIGKYKTDVQDYLVAHA